MRYNKGMRKNLIALAVLVSVGFTGTALAVPKELKEDKKVYVCKYVGKPGVDERLKEGKNPIEVSVSSIKLTPPDTEVSVGDEFADAQGRSVVVADGASCAPATPDKDPVKDPEPVKEPEVVKKDVEVESTTTTPVTEEKVEVFAGK